ncbi:MAG: peptidoglycan-binding protein [Proteobacteria bacterium]|nr:peptidoglycan-binding protein [Pseudomonadota bacterium]
MHPDLRRGDKGEAVVRLQGLLNKLGSMLVPDGDFGPGTARAVREARAEAGLPPADHADETLWRWLEAVPEPSHDIPTEAVGFIVRHEVSSRGYYESHLQAPAYPGAESGVTIGIGYDLRFADPARF